MTVVYRSLLRVAMWGEPPTVADVRIADWVDYLEEFREHRSSAEFARELCFGLVSHVYARCMSVGQPSTVGLALAAVVGGVVSTFAVSGFIDPFVTYSFAGDVHLVGSLVLFAVAMLRRAWSIHANLFRVGALVNLAFAYLHVAIGMSTYTARPVMFVSFLVFAAGLFGVAISAHRSGFVFGRSRSAICLAAFGFALNYAAHIRIVHQVAQDEGVLVGSWLTFPPKLLALWLVWRLFSARHGVSRAASVVLAH